MRPLPPGFSPAVRELVYARSGGRCEICGFDAAEAIHHRRPRAMGSTRRPESNQSANALATSAACHSMLESNRTLALSRGWLVLQNQTPAEVPVMIHGGQWVYLTDDGEVIPASEPKEIA